MPIRAIVDSHSTWINHRGSGQLVKVTTNATTGKVTIQTFGYQPVTVVVVIRASATANYKAYSISHRYYIR